LAVQAGDAAGCVFDQTGVLQRACHDGNGWSRGPEHHREKLMTEVWLFGGSAAAYVKAPSAEKLMSHWPE
jgi:hypothetical protein